MDRSAGTHEGYVGPMDGSVLARRKRTRTVWMPLASRQPWPLDRVEPIAWQTVEVEP